MRRFLSTITLLVLALGFGAYLYFIDAKKPVTEENAKQKVFGLDASKIEQLEVKSASGDVTTLKKDTGGWTILKPIQAPGDQNNAADVASSLSLTRTRPS
jgi:cytochrome oxidase Cu insertion factor (SCO1/SenC/PrrC family)